MIFLGLAWQVLTLAQSGHTCNSIIACFREAPRQWASSGQTPMLEGTFSRFYCGDERRPAYVLQYVFGCEGDGIQYRYYWNGKILNENSLVLENFKYVFAYDGRFFREIQRDSTASTYRDHRRPEPLLPCYFGYLLDDVFLIDTIDKAKRVQVIREDGNEGLLIDLENDKQITVVPFDDAIGMYRHLVVSRQGARTFEARVDRVQRLGELKVATEGEWTLYNVGTANPVFMDYEFTATRLKPGAADFDLSKTRQALGRNVAIVNDESGETPKFSQRSTVRRIWPFPWWEGVCSVLGVLAIAIARWRRRTVVGLLALASLTIASSCGRRERREAIDAVPGTIDVGRAGQAERREFAFQLINRTHSAWRLRGYRKSCGCVLVSELPESISPDGCVQVTGSIETGRNEGDWRQSIYMGYDEVGSPLQVEVPVEVDVSIEKVIGTNPPGILVTCAEGDCLEREIVIDAAKPITLVACAQDNCGSDVPSVSCVTALPVGIGPHGTAIRFSIGAKTCGISRGVVRLRFEGCSQRNMALDYSIIARQGISISPQSLFIQDGETERVRLVVENDSQSVRIQDALEIDAPKCLSVTVESNDGTTAILSIGHPIHQAGAGLVDKCSRGLHIVVVRYSTAHSVRVPVLVRHS